MSSGTIFSADCRQCGWDGCYFEAYTRTFERHFACDRCGATYDCQPKTDRRHLRATGQHRNYLTKNDLCVYYQVERPGCGVCFIAGRSGHGCIWRRFHRPIGAGIIASFRKALLDPKVDAAQSYLTRWNAETGQVEEVVGIWRPMWACDRVQGEGQAEEA